MSAKKKKKPSKKSRYQDPVGQVIAVLTSPAVITAACQLLKGFQAGGKKR